MKKEQKNIFLKKLKEGMEVNKNIFNSIAHDELQLGYVIHTELYNNIIEKYQKMGDIPEQGEKIAIIYSGYSWITLEYLLKAVFEKSEILFFNKFNKIITPILIALIEEVCKDCKIKSPIIKVQEKVDESYLIKNQSNFDKIYFIGDKFEYDKLVSNINVPIIYNNFSHLKLLIDKKKYLKEYKELLKTSIIENYILEEFVDYDDYMNSYSKDDYVIIFSDDQELIEKMKKLSLNNLCINNFSFDNYKFNIKMNDRK